MSHLPHPCSAGLACTHVHLWKSFYVALCGFHVCGLSSGLGWSCGCSPQQVWFSDGEVTRMVGWCRVRPWLPPTLSWCCTVPQEAARLCQPPACSPLCRKAIEGLVALSEDGCSPISIQQMAYVAGVGFGLMSGTFSMINLLADALGPGTTGIHGDSQLYFLTSAFMTMVLIFLHTFWGILFFHGCEHQRWWEITAVVIMHLAVSGSVCGVEPALSWNPEAPWDVPVPSCPCPPLHPGGKSSHHLLCNIFSPGLVDPGQFWQDRCWGLAAAAS
ncbi:uncharacterized protein ACIBXB_006058 isoform 10-T11 [Morphnus guianensis]